MINSRHPETIKSALLAAANNGLCTHALAYLQYAQQHRAEVLNKDLVREALLNAGGYEWTKKGRRIYISRFVKTVVANSDAFGRRGKYDCDHMYYDCETREWVGTPCNVIFAVGFAACFSGAPVGAPPPKGESRDEHKDQRAGQHQA